MRGLSDEERSFVEYVFAYGGHGPRGPKSGRCTEDDVRLIDTLIERGILTCLDCAIDECPFSHPEVTPYGRMAFDVDTYARNAA